MWIHYIIARKYINYERRISGIECAYYKFIQFTLKALYQGELYIKGALY